MIDMQTQLTRLLDINHSELMGKLITYINMLQKL
jgi:hypothetical protein